MAAKKRSKSARKPAAKKAPKVAKRASAGQAPQEVSSVGAPRSRHRDVTALEAHAASAASGALPTPWRRVRGRIRSTIRCSRTRRSHSSDEAALEVMSRRDAERHEFAKREAWRSAQLTRHWSC